MNDIDRIIDVIELATLAGFVQNAKCCHACGVRPAVVSCLLGEPIKEARDPNFNGIYKSGHQAGDVFLWCNNSIQCDPSPMIGVQNWIDLPVAPLLERFSELMNRVRRSR